MLQSTAGSDADAQVTDTEIDTQAAVPRAGVAQQRSEAVRVLQSAALLQGGKRVHIAHNGACYQLQATRQGKLILTK